MNIEAILQNKGGEVVTVRCDTPVRDAVALLAGRKIGALPVLKDEEVVGIMSERDVIYCLARDGAGMLDWPVEKTMTAPVISAEPKMPVLAALGLMTERRIRHLPVLDGKRLVGLVSIGDLVKFRMDRIEAEAAALRNYIQTA
ncbi:MAG TPA: CBS domain-containing protein [Allosphingosinicella sp.]|jgi:CBS domain-containing protein|nr:CBS domain-containing protein [Allosphingosinicella sp.]